MNAPLSLINTRDAALDLIKLVSTVLVICIHVAANGFLRLGSEDWAAVNTYESISRVSVPLFFMITGALLLNKSQSVRAIVARVIRIGIPLIAWSLIYLTWLDIHGVHSDSWIVQIVNGPVANHLWYLYALLGIYLFLPVIAGFYQLNATRTICFTLVFWFIGVSLIYMLARLTGKLYTGISLDFLTLHAGYMVLGAVLYHRINLQKAAPPMYGLVWAGCAVIIACATWLYSQEVGKPDELFYAYNSPLVVIASISAFAFLLVLGRRLSKSQSRLQNAVLQLSRLTFGVYLCHMVILDVLAMRGYAFNFINAWLGIPALTLLTFILSAILVYLIQQLPILKIIAPK